MDQWTITSKHTRYYISSDFLVIQRTVVREIRLQQQEDAHKPATKKLFARMKSMQETCFKRLKDFNFLRESFRHGKGTTDKLAKIELAFEAVAVLCQYDFENGHRLFEV